MPFWRSLRRGSQEIYFISHCGNVGNCPFNSRLYRGNRVSRVPWEGAKWIHFYRWAENMTEEEYYKIVRRFGLRPTRSPETFMTLDNEIQCVPLASTQTADQRRETIERIRRMLNIGVRKED